MKHSQAVLVGFFPKITQAASDWLGNDSVREICSVSNCISDGPENWIDHWMHNDFGFYEYEELAYQVVGEDADEFDLYAYRLYPFLCRNGSLETIMISSRTISLPHDYEFIGYDIVTKTISDLFECSPLSCNAGAEEFPVNQYCLVSDRDTARKVLLAICQNGAYEPGPYYLFEVYRKRRSQAE